MEGAEAFIIQELSLYREYQRDLRKALDTLWEDEDSSIGKRVMILEYRLSMMDYWLSCLEINESFVLTRRLIEGCTWTQLAYDYNRAFGSDEATEDSMCRIQNRAISKIHRDAKVEWTDSFDYLGYC